MKAVINSTLLSKELKKLSLVIKKNTVIPILSTVKFSFEKNKLTLTATDLETTYISEIEPIYNKFLAKNNFINKPTAK